LPEPSAKRTSIKTMIDPLILEGSGR
jgi:hypothetical protein